MDRTNTMLEWLDEDKNYNLVSVYYSDVDHAGHYHGPDSIQTKGSLIDADRAIGKLLMGLKERGIYDQFNIVVVSDHGMTQALDDKKIFLDSYLPDLKDYVKWADFGPIASIIPKPQSR